MFEVGKSGNPGGRPKGSYGGRIQALAGLSLASISCFLIPATLNEECNQPECRGEKQRCDCPKYDHLPNFPTLIQVFLFCRQTSLKLGVVVVHGHGGELEGHDAKKNRHHGDQD